MLGCPFAAHTRKVRPRADHKPDIGKEQDPVAGKFTEPVNGKVEAVGVEYDSDEEPDQKPAKEDASVILRRGITFGPEVGEDEKKKSTIRDRGIYFTCYQSDIRDGFNIIMIRKAPSPLLSFHCYVLHETNSYQAGQATASSPPRRKRPIPMNSI